MQTYDILIQNGMILTLDPELTVIENGAVAIQGDSIAYVGPDRIPFLSASKLIDAHGGIVLPGLVNGHTHAAMTLFRGLADDLPLMEWLSGYIFPAESRMDKDFVRTGSLLACAEMILSGTTTFCDMYLFEDEVAKAARQSGMRSLVGEVLYDFPSPNYGPIEKGFAYTEHLIEKWKTDPLVSIAVEAHALYTCSPDLLKTAHAVSRRHGVPLVIHVAETLSELAEIQAKYGKKPFEHLESLGILGPHIIADHCVHLDDSEIDRMVRHRVNVITNPESNMKLASGSAPVCRMIAAGIPVGLGTDGCASNNNLDMLLEMDTAAKLQKIAAMDPTALDAVTVLKMATIEGAKALGFGDITGSLEPGKKADIIIVDTRKPHLTPLYNPYSHLVYAAGGADVSHSIINGRLVMENRKLLTLDLEDILSRAGEKAALVNQWLSSA
jgi:5-methylthioadenosine/S-adenosylhomocysteine deaminase